MCVCGGGIKKLRRKKTKHRIVVETYSQRNGKLLYVGMYLPINETIISYAQFENKIFTAMVYKTQLLKSTTICFLLIDMNLLSVISAISRN